MYRRIYSPVVILNYLKDKTFKDLPFELWDRYLWLYEPVIELLSKTFSGKPFDNVSLYVNENENEVIGVAYVTRNESNINILIDTSSEDGIKNLIQNLKECIYSTIKISVKNKTVADLLKNALEIEYFSGMANFYARECSVETEYKIDEVKPGDSYLFKNELMPEGWVEIDKYLEEGIQYFTLNKEERSASICGLCYLTVFRAEVIGVGTRESYRKKGYARAVCSYAMREALRNVNVVTWTAKIGNKASCAAAKSLGFIPFVELYHFEISNSQLSQNGIAINT